MITNQQIKWTNSLLSTTSNNSMKSTSPRPKIEAHAYSDSCKLFFDFFKHLTTLSTGAIVILSTYMTKVFQSSSGIHLVANALTAFILSIAASVFAMFVFAGHIQGRSDLQANSLNLITGTGFIAGTCFLYGLCALTWFARMNLL